MGQGHGFCSPQRKFVLPGAQRAPRRKSTAITFGATGTARAHHRGGRKGSLQEASVRGAQLESSARAVQPLRGPGGSPLSGSPKACILASYPQPRIGGCVSAAPPNFRIARGGKGTAGTIAAPPIHHPGQIGTVWPGTRAVRQPARTGSLGGGYERLHSFSRSKQAQLGYD